MSAQSPFTGLAPHLWVAAGSRTDSQTAGRPPPRRHADHATQQHRCDDGDLPAYPIRSHADGAPPPRGPARGAQMSNCCTLLLYFGPRPLQGPLPGLGEGLRPATTSVELRGLEPLTPSLRTRCATSCATAPWCGRNFNTVAPPVRNDGGFKVDHEPSHACPGSGAASQAPVALRRSTSSSRSQS